MRKLIGLAIVVLAFGIMTTVALADSQGFQHDFHGETGTIDFYSLNALCDECFDDDFDTDSGSSALGGQLGIDGNFTWTATNQSVLNYTPALVRQGSTLDSVITTLAQPGTITVNYHFYGAWGLFNDPDGPNGPAAYNPTIFTQSVDLWLPSSISCALPLQGGQNVCEKDEYFGLATINTPFAQFQMRMKVTTVATIDSTGVVSVRSAVVDAGPPIPDANVVYVGSTLGFFVDPLFIQCTQPAGEHLQYSIHDAHLTASTVNLHHSARLNFAVLDPFGIETWSEVDTPGVQIIDATFGNGVELTADDVMLDLGPIAPDVTHPTIEPLGFFIGWEGEPIQLHADATDNCGAPVLRWDFSDGGVAYGANPAHVFPDNGIYTGQLTATDVNGLSTVVDFEVVVLNHAPSVSAGPDKSFDWGLPVPFHANGADQGPVDQGSLLYSWNFDDPADPLGAAGQDVTHVYSQPGVRYATVTVKDKDGASSSDSVQVTVTRRDSTLSYTGGTFGRIGDGVTLRATVIGEYGEPVVGRTVQFSVDGVPVASAMTNGTGVAEASWGIPAGTLLGSHAVSAAFAGDSFYKASDSSGYPNVVTVAREVAIVSYTGPISSKPAKPLTLNAILVDDEGDAVPGKEVTFTLGSQSCTAFSDAFGLASCTISKLAAKSGQYTLTALFAGDGDYLPTQDSTVFTVGK